MRRKIASTMLKIIDTRNLKLLTSIKRQNYFFINQYEGFIFIFYLIHFVKLVRIHAMFWEKSIENTRCNTRLFSFQFAVIYWIIKWKSMKDHKKPINAKTPTSGWDEDEYKSIVTSVHCVIEKAKNKSSRLTMKALERRLWKGGNSVYFDGQKLSNEQNS